MKESKLYNKLFIMLAILLAFINLFNKDVTGLPSIDYAVYASVIVLAAVKAINEKSFAIPRRYLVLMFVVVSLMCVNAAISKYSPPPLYSAIGALITLMPFVFFLAAYNFRMEDSDIHHFIDLILGLVCLFAFIVYADSFVFHTGDRDLQSKFISSGIVRFGDFSSLCTQAIVLCYAEYYRTSHKQYLVVLAFLALTILLTNQLKAIFGMMLVSVLFIFYLAKVRRWVKVFISVACTLVMVAVLSISAVFMTKFENYFSYATMDESYTLIARPALYFRGFEIAADFFPFGSGQGTYGSVPVGLIGNRIYTDYGLTQVWGLGDNDVPNFRMDAHWASIIGEMGFIGAILYLMLFFYPASVVSKKLDGEDEKTRKCYTYIVRAGILTLFFESIVLALPKSFSFIIIYAGLAGLILSRKKSKEEIQ